MTLNNKNLIIIIASLFCFIACATGVIIYSVNSHLDNRNEITTMQQRLKSLMYSRKYAELDVDDPMYARNIDDLAINLLSKEFNLNAGCKAMFIPDFEVPEYTIKALEYLAKTKCVPTYNLIKENFSDIHHFDKFMKAMEYYNPDLKN